MSRGTLRFLRAAQRGVAVQVFSKTPGFVIPAEAGIQWSCDGSGRDGAPFPLCEDRRFLGEAMPEVQRAFSLCEFPCCAPRALGALVGLGGRRLAWPSLRPVRKLAAGHCERMDWGVRRMAADSAGTPARSARQGSRSRRRATSLLTAPTRRASKPA